MTHTLTIQSIEPLARNVRAYRFEKPEGFSFTPGQATDVAVMKEGWEEEERPFTFTSLPDDDHLEFMIKSYPDHDGVTEQIGMLEQGDKLRIGDPWGTIEEKGEGTFIAGGAGMTPFVSILRDLRAKNKLDGYRLFLANKTRADIFPAELLLSLSELDVTHVLSEEQTSTHPYGRIDRDFLEPRIEDTSQHFYVCGPDPMVEDITKTLKDLGADPDGLVFEE